MDSCLFCKIIKGEIPSMKVYEDEDTLAFLDIKPINPGHTLVIPKAHYANVIETPEEVLVKMMRTVKKIGHAFKDGLGVENFNLAMNNGAPAGQVVFHAHIHVMPRHEGDGYELWKGKEYVGDEMQTIGNLIKNAV
jgi:histidine triad (HIT) family protein